MKLITVALSLVLWLAACPIQAAEDGHHPNHMAVATGAARYKNDWSAYIGIDYIRSRPDGWGVGGFYEEVDGDFDLQVIGLLFSKNFHNGWKFNFGPGLERKIKKDKYLAVFRSQVGYDWHSGQWSWGPQLTLDLIEDGNSTWYAGISLGYGW